MTFEVMEGSPSLVVSSKPSIRMANAKATLRAAIYCSMNRSSKRQSVSVRLEMGAGFSHGAVCFTTAMMLELMADRGV